MSSARPQIYIPESGPRCLVRTETVEGSAVPGAPIRMMDPGESAAFTIEPGQRIVIEIHPVEVEG